MMGTREADQTFSSVQFSVQGCSTRRKGKIDDEHTMMGTREADQTF
eukprot:CAMPEP_0206257920 /NCGR_PEP_ID=MMETSP0047_2-20121206/25619_1 /ASSEMBLY_ACC=CAM_ASM_000192 /TAXON_ID=195065 /ORGANISM="Chroomonas mesostigmatica_cf, Strain CCMP1168" /LENGTH=45 /DNA_ID= /DNA_START= /DNA_END= /DNA_ORIENTATION=